jgi:hypothetical protein
MPKCVPISDKIKIRIVIFIYTTSIHKSQLNLLYQDNKKKTLVEESIFFLITSEKRIPLKDLKSKLEIFLLEKVLMRSLRSIIYCYC